MSSEDDDRKNLDLYAVLGLKKECTASELRNAYKKLALRWHPDRCSASGNSKFVEEAKTKFQAIQHAYAVLSDVNKRFMYDVGVNDSDDDENGMGDFLNDMAALMTQTKPGENGEESFEELQELFKEMFHMDIEALGSHTVTMPSCSSSTSYTHSSEVSGSSNKRNSSDMISGMGRMDSFPTFDTNFSGFCLGVEAKGNFRTGGGARGVQGGANKRRNGRKQRVSYGHDVPSQDTRGFIWL